MRLFGVSGPVRVHDGLPGLANIRSADPWRSVEGSMSLASRVFKRVYNAVIQYPKRTCLQSSLSGFLLSGAVNVRTMGRFPMELFNQGVNRGDELV